MEVLERIISSMRQNVSSIQWSRSSSAVTQFVSNSMNCIKLPPLTRDNVLYYYMPIQGLTSYTLLSISIMNPHLVLRVSPRRDLTNILLLGAGSGAGLWLWSRPHFSTASPSRRFSWAFLGGTLWSLGSVLLWAILRNACGRIPITSTLVGLASGATLTHAAVDYFHFVEVMFCGEIHLPEEIYNSDDEKYSIDHDLDI